MKTQLTAALLAALSLTAMPGCVLMIGCDVPCEKCAKCKHCEKGQKCDKCGKHEQEKKCDACGKDKDGDKDEDGDEAEDAK